YNVTLKVSNSKSSDIITKNQNVVVLPTTGLIAYYPFNSGGKDESGNGFDGQMKNGVLPVEDRNNLSNKALYFDGVDDYVVTSTSIDEHLSQGASFSAWVYLTEGGAYG